MRYLPLPLTLLVLLALPVAAAATVYCSGGPGLCVGTPVSPANLEAQALTGPARSDGQADVVVLGPTTFTDPDSWKPTGSDDLLIRGAGAGTVMTSSAATNSFVMDHTNAKKSAITLRDLAVRAPASFPDDLGSALQTYGSTLEDVRVQSANVGSDALGSAVGGGELTGVVVEAVSAGTVDVGVRTNAGASGPLVIRRSSITARAPFTASGGGVPAEISRSTLDSTVGPVVEANAGASVTVLGSVLRSGAADTTPLVATAFGSDNTLLHAHHVTLVNEGNTSTAALWSYVGPNGTGNAQVTMNDSIARGFGTAAKRTAPVNDPAKGNANVTVTYSNLKLGVQATGDGLASFGPGMLDADPKFKSASDLRLQGSSPSLDTGGPSMSSTDGQEFDGNPRVLDGNGDGVVRRDMGAFEAPAVQPPPADPPANDPPPAADPGTPAGSGGGTGGGTTGGGTTGGGTTGGGTTGGVGPTIEPGPGPTAGPGQPDFGADPGVRVSLGRRGKLTVRNANAFAVTASVAATTTGRKPIRVGRATTSLAAGASRTLKLRLSRRARGKRLRITATLTSPAGTTRTATTSGGA